MNPYEILGVEKNATPKEVKTAYRKLAQKHHPDRNDGDAGAEKKFKEVSAAYEVLSDPQKRQQYDQFGATGGQGGGGFNAQGFDFGQFSQGSAFSDIFESFFGGGGQSSSQPRNFRGSDIELALKIDFKDAVFGGSHKISYRRQEQCNGCKGAGAEAGSKVVGCSKCNGSGQVKEVRRTFIGQVVTQRVCDECHGRGQVPEKVCSECNGASIISSNAEMKIKIPAGINNGATLRLSGKGNVGMYNHETGDLYVMIQVKAHNRFMRDGDDIYTTEKIHALQAILGDEIEIETVHGKKHLKIVPGTTENKVYRIKGEGVPHMQSGGNGDHYCKVKIDIPSKLTHKEKDLYLGIANESGLDITPQKKGLFN